MNSIVIFILPLFLGLGFGFGAPFSNELTGKMAVPNRTLNIKTEDFQLQIIKSHLVRQKIPKNLIHPIRNVDTDNRAKNESQHSTQSPEMGYLKLIVFLIEHICRLIGLIA
ncbi:uncharacterized protein LOC120444960 [Drosophila santomea]|uniref:uncharacterized protein LOC120444960 n=1 Tax=Drosophila santomea TaxID=129105 RepID=UPI001953512D|nr:uncharacterized protein LOC120444960 [Drosophila santomea]